MLTPGEILFGKYRVTKPLGAGGFAEVFEAKNLLDSQRIAIKVEKECRGEFKTVEHEAVILSKLVGVKKVPQVVFLKKTPKCTYLGLKLLGRNLFALRKEGELVPSVENLTIIALELLNTIEALHAKDVIHLDIKPDNIVLGKGKSTHIHLIDFGISVDASQRSDRNYSMLGSPLFCSGRRMEYRSIAKKDDLESWLYTLIFLANWRLPWEEFIYKKSPGWKQAVIDSKKTSCAELLCQHLPKEMIEITHYLRNLSPIDRPSYSFIRGLLELAAERLHLDLSSGLHISRTGSYSSTPKLKPRGMKSVRKAVSSNYIHAVTAVEQINSSGAPSTGKMTLFPVDPNAVTPKNMNLTPTVTETLRAHLAIGKKRRGSACE